MCQTISTDSNDTLAPVRMLLFSRENILHSVCMTKTDKDTRVLVEPSGKVCAVVFLDGEEILWWRAPGYDFGIHQ